MIRHANRRDFIKTATLALPLIAAGCHNVPKPKASSANFVTIRNRQFERRARPYSFLGANFYQAAMLGDPGLAGGRKRLIRELDQLRSIGVTNLRIMAGSEGSFATGHGRRGMLARPGQWDEGLLRGLDFVLAEMAKRDMTSVLYLTNYWEWSGGMAAYVNWATGEPIPNPNQSGIKHTGPDHMTYAARFYGLPRAQEFFREHITHVVNRRNTVSGQRYYDDPTIMAWQLSNEPRPGRDNPATEANLPAFYNWMNEAAHFIKTLAPRHLVSTGSEGTMGCIGRSDAFLKAHQSPAVDYTTLHLWVKNWGWLKEPHLGPQYEQAVSRATHHIEEHITLATQLGKPLVMEEFGINRDNESTVSDSTTTMRDDYYSRMFQCVLDSCQTGSALQAANFWVWSGEGSLEALLQRRAGNSKFREPADHNGVLHSDQTTLSVIRKYNTQLARLAG